MENLKRPYEISLWEDILTFVVDNEGDIIKYEGSLEGAIGQVKAQYYQERKICTIGSNTMDTPIRAHEPILVSNINGSNTLTFKMYSKYWDDDVEDFRENPFLEYLVNERKIKVRVDESDEEVKWYDLVIKNVEQDSDTKIFTYTAIDIFINELSKSGFGLEFDTELGNNMGTVTELGAEVLAESDWKVREENDIIRQYIEEPLYEIILKEQITVQDMLDSSKKITIPASSEKSPIKIYGFYNCIVNKTPYFQFLYSESGQYNVDDNYIIVSSSNWYIDNVQYLDDNLPSFGQTMTISEKFRGKRLARKILTVYDSTVDKYVAVYKDSDKNEIYGYVETDYLSPASVRSFVTNGSNFTSTAGWNACGEIESGEVVMPELSMTTVPNIQDIDSDSILDEEEIKLKTYLKWRPTLKFATTDETDGQGLINTGIADHRQYIENFTKDEEYIFRIKYWQQDQAGKYGAKTLMKSDVELKFEVCEYTVSEGKYIKEKVYFSDTVKPKGDSDYEFVKTKCLKTLEYSAMIEKPCLGLIITPMDAEKTLYFEDIQFFKYYPKDESSEGFLLPDELGEGKTVNTYYYYYPNSEYKSIKDVKYIYTGNKPASYIEAYNEDFEKIRSITAKESNRFNLIQDLCEIFECWARFEIEHNEDGSVKLDENYRPLKWVSFHEYIGKENFAGFKYGINLKQIQRTIESESIASKIIVKNNSNEFGKNGFCSISRAEENPSGENFILDFSYYIQQQMLGLAELTNDLYLDINGYIGYFKKLREINKLRDEYIEEQAGLLSTIAEYESYYQTYSTLLSEADELLTEQNSYLFNYTGYTFKQLMDNKNNAKETKIQDWWKDEKVIGIMSSIGYLKTIISNYSTLVENSNKNLTDSKARYELLTRTISSRLLPEEEQKGERRLLLEKESVNKQFYKKYSRFLQEGSWISEDYIDDELYYLDACGVARVSAQPKVNYVIDVIELSQVEGYENYRFSVGDKTTIEDTEFFGWVLVDGLKTPRKEEVIVSETTIEFDSPEKNKIKVQNYKTQFEDLFQRMAATTQSIEYSTGEYNKVATIVEPNGTISVDTLQNSFSNNAFILSNAKDQSVVWDESGITTINLKNPSEIVRIVSGGVFVSTDGGISWNTGLTGRGINANYITSGQLDTNRINILNGSFPSFRWDGTGISAYEFTLNQETREVSQFDYGKFVRLDQYGLYGINGYPNFDSSVLEDGMVGEEKIWNKANFALTWKGFMLKSSHVDGGYISITSADDFQVIDGNGKARVKIGKINDAEEKDIYGFQILNENGPVMEHNSAGELWIKNEIKIGGDNSSVSIGYFNGVEKEVIDDQGNPMLDESGNPIKDTIHEVINANDSFIVFDDGSVKATNGEFTGIIRATGGTIGNLTISEANGISAAISEAGLVFNENGLTITNAGLTIKNTLGEDVLKGDDNGNLTITGKIIATDGEFNGTVCATDGEFNGTVYATDGEFSGKITALSGEIGGFTIEKDKLVSSGKEIELNGTEGSIYAKNITLGEGAKIESFIKLGENVQLKSVGGEKSFLTVTNDETGDTILNMNSLGEIQVGPDKNRIFINGTEGIIYTSNFESGQGWKISNEDSIFNDVIIRGSIKASVLEYGEVQSVGGTLLVRPSSKIKKVEEEEIAEQEEGAVEKRIKLTLESREGFQVGNICLIAEETNKTYAEIVSVPTELSDNTITIKSTKAPDFFVGKVIVNLGKTGDVGIGINGSESNSLVASQSISVFEFNGEQKSLSPKIILGKLPDEEDYGFARNTYGLYAENVILKGSLVTGKDEGSYSGIRTTYSEGNAPISTELESYLQEIDPTFTPSEILFWAGSQDASPEQIAKSRFFVDKNGYMYAGGGYFNGSIITNSVISSAEIKTAKITGTGTNPDPALLIKDAAVGIDFVATKEQQEWSVFKVSSDEITANVNSLKFNTVFQIMDDGTTFVPDIFVTNEDKAINISSNQIIAYKSFTNLETKTMNSSIELSENFAVSFPNKEKAFVLNNESATINTDWYFNSTSVINYGEKMRYEPVKDINEKVIGYDLYVLEFVEENE